MWSGRSRVGLALVLLSASLAPRALAQPSSPPPSLLELSWSTSDPTCTGEPVAAAVLREARVPSDARPLSVVARVTRDADAWLVELDTRRGDRLGRRELRGGSCAEVQQAVALLIALILESGDSEPAPPRAAPPRVPPPPVPPPPPPPPPPAVPARSDLAWLIRGEAYAGLFAQPGVGFGFGGRTGMDFGPVEVWAGFHQTLETLESGPLGEASASRRSVELDLCWSAWSPGPLELLPCVSPQLGWLRGRARWLDEPSQETDRLLVGGTVALDARLWVGRSAFFFALRPAVTLEYSVALEAKFCPPDVPEPACPRATFYETTGIAPRLEAGAGLRF